MEFPGLAKLHIGLFEAEGQYQIQRIDETAPEDYTDNEALLDVIRLARQGDLEAIEILHLDGHSVEDADEVRYIQQLHAEFSPNDCCPCAGCGRPVLPAGAEVSTPSGSMHASCAVKHELANDGDW